MTGQKTSKFVADAKVAEVAADSQLAITAGSNNGVKLGDIVTLHRVVKVTDPETKEPLGSVTFPRLRLRVNHVQDRFSVAIVTDHVGQRNIFDVTEVRRLKTVTTKPTEEDASTILVKIGEQARVTREPEEEEPPF